MSNSSLSRKLFLTSLLFVLGFVFLEGLASTVLVAIEFLRGERATAGGASNIEYDPELGWGAVKSAYLPDMFGAGIYLRTNAQGIRSNREFIPSAVPPGKTRLLCSGDSFTFGYGVDNDHTWCRQLEVLSPRLETVNLGQIGYGIDQSYLRFKRDGVPLDHQLNLFAFITTDFHRMGTDRFLGYGKPILKLVNGALTVQNVPVPKKLFTVPWWLDKRLQKLGGLRLVELLQDIFQSVPGPKEDPWDQYRQIFDLSVSVFADLDRLNHEHGSVLVLVYLPTNVDQQSEMSTFWRESLQKAAAQHGWVYWDLVEELRKLSRNATRDYFRPEGHYTVAGNVYIAEQLYRRLSTDPRTSGLAAPRP